MTLSAKDTASSFSGIYRQVFSRGFVGGYRGGSGPTMASMPQFTAIGPVYLAAERALGNPMLAPIAVVVASTMESLFSFSVQRKNAAIQFNAVRPKTQQIVIPSSKRLVAPGFVAHVGRNALAMTGIRVFSPHLHSVVEGNAPFLGAEGVQIVSDLTSSIVAATLSMPCNHIFSWAACTPELEQMSPVDRGRAQLRYITRNYTEYGVGLLFRDLRVRICYTGFLFTLYHIVERRMIE